MALVPTMMGVTENSMNNNDSEHVEGEDVKRLMKDHLVDKDTTEKAQELIDEGLDEDEAIEVAEEL